MKANELMIGDWVISNDLLNRPARYAGIFTEHTPLKGQPYRRLRCMWPGDIEGADVPEERVLPIHLTSEILEKIGFSYGYTASEEGCDCLYEKGWCYSDENGEVKVTFPHGTDGGEIYVNDYSFRTLRLIFPDKIYLHELQHALKLGGIDKEITIE